MITELIFWALWKNRVSLLVFLILTVSLITIPFSYNPIFAATYAILSIHTSQKSVPVGDKITFSGKLTGMNLDPIANAEIIIWENDGGRNTHVAQTTTNNRGEYQVTVTAKEWDGKGNAVEIFAFSGIGSVSSSTIIINIDKPSLTSSSSQSQSKSSTNPVPTKSSSQSQSKSSTTVTSTSSSENNAYQGIVSKTNQKQSKVISLFDSAVKHAKEILSGLIFENSDAKQKIELAWKHHWNAKTKLDDSKSKLRNSESYFDQRAYKTSYQKLLEIQSNSYSIKSELYQILSLTKDAKSIEVEYQKKIQRCVLSWCDQVKFYEYLEPRFTNLISKLNEIERELSVLEQEKNLVNERIKYEKELEKKELEISSIKAIESKKQQEYEVKLRQEQQRAYEEEQRRLQEQREYEEELRQQEIQAEMERQRLQEQKSLDDERNQIRVLAKDNPLIRGLMQGELAYYVKPLPSYASQDVRNQVENLASWMDGKTINGVKLKRSYSYTDFSINWVKDYQEEAIGRQVGGYLIVGLGSTSCYGDWKPFNGYTVFKIMWHEIGHAMGYDHVSDPNNIMYEHGTSTKYEYDYSDTIILSDGYWRSIQLCNSGSIYFTTERTSSSDGYKVYVIPSNTDPSDVISGNSPFYLDCSGYEDTWKSFSSNCNVETGSSLVLYNPSLLGAGTDIPIKVKIYNKNNDRELDTSFPNYKMYYSQEFLNRVVELFR